MSLTSKFNKHVEIGGHFKSTESHREELFQEAEQLGITVMVANCDRARSRSAVLRAIAKAVDYLQFFGNDIVAFYVCFSNTVVCKKNVMSFWLICLHIVIEVFVV